MTGRECVYIYTIYHITFFFMIYTIFMIYDMKYIWIWCVYSWWYPYIIVDILYHHLLYCIFSFLAYTFVHLIWHRWKPIHLWDISRYRFSNVKTWVAHGQWWAKWKAMPMILILFGQWLNFKLLLITYLVGKISRSNFYFRVQDG